MKLYSSAVLASLLAFSCSKSPEAASAVKGEPLLPAARADCRDALTNDFSVDSQAFTLHMDEVEGYDGGDLTLDAAKSAIKAVAKKLNCEEATLRLAADVLDGGAVQNACAEVVPGINLSKACYVASEDSGPGYFMVHTTLPEGLTVSFSRWD